MYDLILPKFNLTTLVHNADLVGRNPEEDPDVHLSANNYLLDQDPSLVCSCVQNYLLLPVDCAVYCQHTRFEIIAELEDLSLLSIHGLWQIELTTSQAILLPENYLRFEFSVDLLASLETSHTAAIWHEANWQFKS